MISIILSVYNEEAFIEEALRSLLSQTRGDLEALVVDDFSTDATLRIVNELSREDSRIRPLANTRKGKVNAYNVAYSQARGDLFALMGGDDVLPPDSLEARAGCLTPGELDAGFCDMALIDAAGRRFSAMSLAHFVPLLDRFEPNTLISGIPAGAWMFTKRVAEAMLPFPDGIPYEDSWMSFVIRKGFRARHVPRELYCYRQHGRNTFGRMNRLPFPVAQYRAGRNVAYYDFFLSRRDTLRLSEKEVAFATQHRFDLARMVESKSLIGFLGSSASLRSKMALVYHMAKGA